MGDFFSNLSLGFGVALDACRTSASPSWAASSAR